MSNDSNRRMLLTEGLITGGLTTIGLITGLGPLASLAANIGGNMAANLAARSIQSWRAGWLTERGALNQDIARALLSAFGQALRVLEHEWKQHPHYLHLRQTDPDIAQQTLMPLHWLGEDAVRLFQHPEHLTSMFQQLDVSSLLHQDENYVRSYIVDILDQYLYGHDDILVTFVKQRLADEWLQQFHIVLHDPDEEGTRAWRATQQLWQASLEAAVEQLEQHAQQTLTIMSWLQQWAQRLDQLQRDSTGEEALEEALRPIYERLDEIRRQREQVASQQKRQVNVNYGNQGIVQTHITGGTFTFHFPGEKSPEQG